MNPHTRAGDTVLRERVFRAVDESTCLIEGYTLHADELALMAVHVVDVLHIGHGDCQRGDIVVDGEGGGGEHLRDGELQQAVVVGEGAVDVGNLIASLQRGGDFAVRVVDDDGAGGILDEDLVTVAVVDARHDDVAGELIDIVAEVGAVDVKGVGPFGAQGGDVGHLELGGDTVGEGDGVGSHHVAGDVSHIVDNQGVSVAFDERGSDRKGHHAAVQGGGADCDAVVKRVVGGSLSRGLVQRLVEDDGQGAAGRGHRRHKRGVGVRTQLLRGDDHIVEEEPAVAELIKEIKQFKKKIVVVLSCGSAVEMPFVENVDAILHCYLNGQAGALAALNILSGKVNPSGKLSETLPVKYEDVASSDNFPSHTRTIEYREAYGVGYRYFEKANVKPAFPFGFGLSYTTFEYKNLKVDEKGVSFEITNTGKVDGKEIAQLYVGLDESEIIRPVKELKGFVKVFLKAGETKQVSIPFDDKTFRYFNVKTNKWEIEKGVYDIYVGADSDDIKLTAQIEQEGTGAEAPYDKIDLPNYAVGNLRNLPDAEFELLLGHPIPDGSLPFYKKNRMVVDYNTTMRELRYAKRWIGRLVGKAIPWFTRVLIKFGNRELANTLIMGVVHQPMRGMSRFSGGGLHMSQLDGLIMMFNGHFWKGLHHYNKEGRKYKKIAKAEKKAQKEAEKAK